MKAFQGLLVYCLIAVMVLGIVNFSMAFPLSRENFLMESYGGKSDPNHQEILAISNRAQSAKGSGCRNQSAQGVDLYFMPLHKSGGDCSFQLGEGAGKMYASGCLSLRPVGHKQSDDQCAEEEQLLADFGNLILYSSDQVLGRIDSLENPAESHNPHSTVLSGNQQENRSWNTLSPSIIMLGPMSMSKVYRHDRMSTKLFDGEKYEGENPNLAFDHQLVMSGKLAHLVPKAGQSPRSLELGDLVILLLFAMIPEKKHIKYLIHRTRQLRLF